jgi:hypothetical protein
MYKIVLEVEGIVPMRHNALTMEAKENIRIPTTGKRKNDEELKTEADRGIYRDDKGEICIEAKALKAVGRNGAGRIKISRRTLTQDFKGALHFENQFIPLLDEKGKRFTKPTGYHFEFVKIPPKKGTPVPKMWAYFDKWHIKSTAVVVDDRISVSAIKDAFTEGGMLYGLLDGRPDWGRFVVKKCEKINH